jgi:hypothetical protein
MDQKIAPWNRFAPKTHRWTEYMNVRNRPSSFDPTIDHVSRRLQVYQHIRPCRAGTAWPALGLGYFNQAAAQPV